MKNAMNKRQTERMRRFASKGLFDDTDHQAIKWAETQDELEQAFSLVYKEYLELGYIQEPNPSHMFFNIHNLLPNSATSVMKYGREVLSTISIVIDNKHFGLPLDALYHLELSRLRRQGRRLCEVCALATSQKARWGNMFMPLFRLVFWHAVNNNMDDICIMVNPKHVPFYKAIIVFEDLGPEKLYPRVGAPAVALRINLDVYKEKLREAYRRFEPKNSLYSFVYECRSTSLKNQKSMLGLKEHKPIDAHIAQHFLVKEKNILKKLSLSQRDYMLNIH